METEKKFQTGFFKDLTLSDEEMMVLKGGYVAPGEKVNQGCHCNCDLNHFGCGCAGKQEYSNRGCHCGCYNTTPPPPSPTPHAPVENPI